MAVGFDCFCHFGESRREGGVSVSVEKRVAASPREAGGLSARRDLIGENKNPIFFVYR